MRFLLKSLLMLAIIGSLNGHPQLWKKFKLSHNKLYLSQSEENLRYSVFLNNLHKIQEHNTRYNKGLVGYKMAITQFADLTKEEFSNKHLNLRGTKRFGARSDNNDYFTVPVNVTLSEAIDWRQQGAVTEVKNQLQCGSCWSFSVTGSIEGQNFIKNHQLVELSEQNLVDCAGGEYGNAGCSGGFLDSAFEYVENNGIAAEADYPYEGIDDTCRSNTSGIVLKIAGYKEVQPFNENALTAAVSLIGPVSIAVDASEWYLYSEGIFDNSECSQEYVNHGVLAVGYGKDNNGTQFWIIKNSWGSLFGESGYLRMLKGVNKCGIALGPMFPIL